MVFLSGDEALCFCEHIYSERIHPFNWQFSYTNPFTQFNHRLALLEKISSVPTHWLSELILFILYGSVVHVSLQVLKPDAGAVSLHHTCIHLLSSMHFSPYPFSWIEDKRCRAAYEPHHKSPQRPSCSRIGERPASYSVPQNFGWSEFRYAPLLQEREWIPKGNPIPGDDTAAPSLPGLNLWPCDRSLSCTKDKLSFQPISPGNIFSIYNMSPRVFR